MFEIIALLCVGAALTLLVALSVIDLKERILPNELVAGVFVLGFIFHLCMFFSVLPPADMALGALSGAGILYLIRAAGNRIYNQDTLGLGDVKLMGAAGIWLGPYYILIALVTGAMAGIVHGLFEALRLRLLTGKKVALATLSLPAGPGFAVGTVVAGGLLLYETRDMWK